MGISDVVGLKIKGANFERESSLILFNDSSEQGCGIVYGKNGSGKSTISRAFSCISGKEEETIEVAKLIDRSGEDVLLSDEEKNSIYVFNENFVDENVKLDKDATGLETIVILGKKNSIQKQLDDAEKKYSDLCKEHETQQSNMQKYFDNKNKESKLFWYKTIKDKLKEKDGWAQRDQKIKNRSIATRVSDDTYEAFVSSIPTRTESELRNLFMEKIKELNDARSGKKKIEKVVDTKKHFTFEKEYNLSLLERKIQEPILSDREKYLLVLLKEYGANHTNTILEKLSPSSVTKCPYCLQELTPEYKENLFESIKNILSKEADDHRKELKEKIFCVQEFDFSPYEQLKTYDEVAQKALESLNIAIDEWNSLVEKKINNIYVPIKNTDSDIDKLYKDYIDALTNLENARCEYNKSVTDTAPLENLLVNINNELAYYEVLNSYNELSKAKTNEELANKNFELLTNKMKRALEEVNALVKKKIDFKIALDEINEGLKYIFFDKDRLTIELEGDEYILKSRGKRVTPNRVSVGERNAIALCYYFSNIFRERKEEELYSKQYLLVIDDPVSSFDKDNRIGIISYLRREINKFKRGNSNTKILLLSHDLQTTYDLTNVFGDINEKYKIGELKNNGIENFDLKHRNEYSKLLQQIYMYAKGSYNDFQISVGNAMRRVLEAYGTFNYRKGMSDLSCVPEITKNLGPFADYFESLMYRLMLNGDSHSATRVVTLESDYFFTELTEEERIRVSKEVICFLYMLDEYHVLQHLKDLNLNDVKETIEGWKEDIAKTHKIEIEQKGA